MAVSLAVPGDLINIKISWSKGAILKLSAVELEVKLHVLGEEGRNMASYCLEIGNEEADEVIVHDAACATYNHGSLLGLGRLVNLGEFATSLQALRFVRLSRPDAIRCLDCCHVDLVLPRAVQDNTGISCASSAA